ncbi:SAF domain-containing protein [Catellatospora paridis]|uniref:SAF domain-containing protein n=1 Tax=Catellatospora paridis TaxID=1617086 RepID=UPI0018AF95A6|nr:SAF domain-containing protein [Catellatospora paridis]
MSPTAVPRPTARGRRLPVAHLVAGLLLVAVSVMTAVQVIGRLDDRTAVLALTRDVAAGQVLSAADLSQARVTADAGLDLVPVERMPQVVGRPAAVPLKAGSLLSAAQLGDSGWPPAGKVRLAVGVPAGRMPADVTAGATVTIHPAPAAGQQTQPSPAPAASGVPGDGGPVRAVVVAVSPAPDMSGWVVSVLCDSADASRVIAATGGEVSIVVEAG